MDHIRHVMWRKGLNGRPGNHGSPGNRCLSGCFARNHHLFDDGFLFLLFLFIFTGIPMNRHRQSERDTEKQFEIKW